MEPENEELLTLGDSNKTVSDEDEMKAGDKRSEAQAAMADGNFEEAVKVFTEAIELNPRLAMLFAKRAQCYVK